MKKKLLTVTVLLGLSFLFAACSSSNKTVDSSKKEDTNKSSKADEPKNSYTIDGITITANNFSVEPYDDANGTYTKRISVMFNIKNDTDKAFGYIKSCEGRLSDGFKLESWTNIQDLDRSGSS